MIPRDAIYSSTALANRQREVKDVAQREVVHITENGNGAYVFCSEDVFARELERAREEARYAAELELVARRGRCDIEEGRYTDDVGSFVARIRQERGIDG